MICNLPEHNLQLIDVNVLFDNFIEVDILNSLKEFNLLTPKIKLKNPDVLKLIYHHVTWKICDHIKNNPKGHVVMCIMPNMPATCEILQYCKQEDLFKALNTLYNKIQRTLPILFVKLNGINTITDFCDNIKQGKGEYIEQFESILTSINKRNKRIYSLKGAKEFTAQYELHFLNKQYFEELKVKSALMVR